MVLSKNSSNPYIYSSYYIKKPFPKKPHPNKPKRPHREKLEPIIDEKTEHNINETNYFIINKEMVELQEIKSNEPDESKCIIN